MAKANATKAADKAETKRKAAKGEQMSTVLSAPKPDKDRAPREDNYGKKERQTPKPDINAEDEGKDKVYGVASRARWAEGDDIQTLSQDAQEAEQSANENRE